MVVVKATMVNFVVTMVVVAVEGVVLKQEL